MLRIGCGHCKKMKPNYTQAAEQLSASGFKGRLAMLDCTENPEVTEEYEISGFPTIKLFRNGRIIREYTGKRTIEDLVNFMKNAHKEKEEL